MRFATLPPVWPTVVEFFITQRLQLSHIFFATFQAQDLHLGL